MKRGSKLTKSTLDMKRTSLIFAVPFPTTSLLSNDAGSQLAARYSASPSISRRLLRIREPPWGGASGVTSELTLPRETSHDAGCRHVSRRLQSASVRRWKQSPQVSRSGSTSSILIASFRDNIPRLRHRTTMPPTSPPSGFFFNFQERETDKREMRMEVRNSAQVEKDRTQKVEKDKARKVDLSGMSLSSLPNPTAELLCITKLDISNNHLESIPESLTARLLNLEELDVHSNQLKVLPNSIGCLMKLKVLNVSSNLLVSLPKAIENCRALEELSANFNQLTRLPDTIGYELTNLRTLSVNSNKLAFLPSTTSHLTSLLSLDARLNCLTSLPDDLENLIRLQSLDLSQNFHHLSSLTFSLGLLVSLTDLDVSYNNLTTLPNSLGCLTKLRTLHVEGNPLVSPPVDVVSRGINAMREYLSARMNETGKNDGHASTKTSFIGKLVKCTTFGGSIAGLNGEREEFLLPDNRLVKGFATPTPVGTFSPRRLFSSRKSRSLKL